MRQLLGLATGLVLTTAALAAEERARTLRDQRDAAFAIRQKNTKDERVAVKMVEPLVGDRQMLLESHPHTKEAANQAAWQVSVPANGVATLRCRVRERY